MSADPQFSGVQVRAVVTVLLVLLKREGSAARVATLSSLSPTGLELLPVSTELANALRALGSCSLALVAS